MKPAGLPPDMVAYIAPLNHPIVGGVLRHGNAWRFVVPA